MCMRACECGGEGGGRLSIMVCPLRGNYAEFCECYRTEGWNIMGCLPPLCVCVDVS